LALRQAAEDATLLGVLGTAALDWRISVAAWNEQCWLRLSFEQQIVSGGYMLFTNWMKITGDAAMLGIETQQVMHLRMMKLFAGGPQAQSEALRMGRKDHRARRGYDDVGPRRIGPEGYSTIPNPR